MATKNRIQILASISAAVLVAASLISACDGGSPTAAEAQLPSIVDLGGREPLTTDGGQQLGPFDLPDAASHRFDIDVVTGSLRLDVVESNGGNTGLIEFAAYGTPL